MGSIRLSFFPEFGLAQLSTIRGNGDVGGDAVFLGKREALEGRHEDVREHPGHRFLQEPTKGVELPDMLVGDPGLVVIDVVAHSYGASFLMAA
jgi:hypothetical protein